MAKTKTAQIAPPVAKLAQELVFQIPNSKGQLAEVLDALARGRINIQAYCAHDDGELGTVMLIPDDVDKAVEVLKTLGIKKFRSCDIVFVIGLDKIGSAARLASIISRAGINITYSFASAGGGRKFGMAIQTDDNPKAVQALNKA